MRPGITNKGRELGDVVVVSKIWIRVNVHELAGVPQLSHKLGHDRGGLLAGLAPRRGEVS